VVQAERKERYDRNKSEREKFRGAERENGEKC